MACKTLFSLVSVVAALQGANAALTRRVACPDGKNTATNAACCQLFAVRDDLQENLFHGGQCTAEAHESLRLTFHDAIAISPALEAQGKFGIQFAGAIGASNCAGAPQLAAFVGRKDATQPAPDGLVPEPFHTPDQIFDRLADASQGEFDPILTVWLLTAHTVAAANDVDPTRSGLPFDSTPELWDTQFFVETQLRGTLFPGSGGNQGEVESALPGEIRLQSDHTIARDSRTACEWQSFVGNQTKAQQMFQFVFHDLSILGQDINQLVDCTEVVPIPAPPVGSVHFPAGITHADVEQACADTPFPTLPTAPGPKTSVAAVPKPNVK
ncbi:class II peroxidase [Trametes sanguinea]|nr:class II peroxidase [Trametes sanguinea]